MTKIKFYLLYYWFVGTLRDPILTYLKREFRWEGGDRIEMEVLNLHPRAIRDMKIVKVNSLDTLVFLYSEKGCTKSAWIPLTHIIHLGAD